jgi:hypothetical protein
MRCMILLGFAFVFACSSPESEPDEDAPARELRSAEVREKTAPAPAACASPRTQCGTSCTDTTVDPAHCGVCGNACSADTYCSASKCQPRPVPGGCTKNCTVDLLVRAYVDGRSELLLSRAGMRWHHVSGAAPGRWRGANEPTFVNGNAWTPAWPAEGENRDCGCASDVAPNVAPLGFKPQTVTMKPITGRGTVTVEQPTQQNQFEARIVFDDPAREPGWYEVAIRYEM